MKIFDVIAVGDQIPLFNLVSQKLREAMSGKTDQFYFNIDHYLHELPETRYSIAQRGSSRLYEYFNTYGWKGNPSDIIDTLDLDYLSIFQTLEDFVCVGIDMESEGYPTALYTRSLPILKMLYSTGMVSAKVDKDKMLKDLIGNKTTLSLKDGTFVAVRLDIEGHLNGDPIFKPVTPKSNLNIGGGKRHVLIPLPFLYMMDHAVAQIFRKSAFSFVKSTIIGQVSHNATCSRDVVKVVYEGSDNHLLDCKLRKVVAGYDAIHQRFFAYDLESSLHSVGVASFRPEMLDSITAIDRSQIDRSRHNIDFTLLRAIFKTRVNGAKVSQLDNLKLIDLSGFANATDKASAIIEAGESKSDKDLFFFMRNHPELFGNLEEVLEKRERVTPRFMKKFKVVDLPELEEDRVSLITDMLSRGVVRFTSVSKSGTVFERVGTSNTQVLERMLGKDYVKNFESIRNKLYHVRGMMLTGQIRSRSEMEQVAVDYNILDYVDHSLFFSVDYENQQFDSAVESVNKAIEVLIEKAKNRKVASNQVMYRSVYATNPKDFFGSLNVNTIISIDFAEV